MTSLKDGLRNVGEPISSMGRAVVNAGYGQSKYPHAEGERIFGELMAASVNEFSMSFGEAIDQIPGVLRNLLDTYGFSKLINRSMIDDFENDNLQQGFEKIAKSLRLIRNSLSHRTPNGKINDFYWDYAANLLPLFREPLELLADDDEGIIN